MSLVNRLRMLAGMNISIQHAKGYIETIHRPVGVSSKKVNGARITELSICSRPSQIIRCGKINQRTASCRCFELLNEHNTKIKIDPKQFSTVADNDKRPYAQRNFTALLFSPNSRLPSLQCFNANVPKICIACCRIMKITKKANPVLDAAST